MDRAEWEAILSDIETEEITLLRLDMELEHSPSILRQRAIHRAMYWAEDRRQALVKRLPYVIPVYDPN